ncbi:hypothetical protein AVEN_152054-1 [Araneus ventricosus]|uniref:Retrovirus-related Pol polyprotein from type-1 retrotransposable element R1 n=1 Tax=Araneus ventricosus TaxID=182803 RepID=A0A4Y2N9I8_ARAVE|nr:hypothetical protein AVEN_152054-1 [Araneus ventricosus]
MEPSCSDHHSISFSLYTGKIQTWRKRRTRMENLDQVAFRKELSREIGNWRPPLLLTAENIDQETDRLLESIQRITKVCRRSNIQIVKKETWWTRKLEIQHSDVSRAQRKHYAAKDPRDRRFLRARWKKLESEYKWAINKAKRDEWADVCQKVTPEEPFGTHFDVAKNPYRRHFQLSSITKEDGTQTRTPEETLDVLLQFHFPTDPGDTEPEHVALRQTTRTPPSSQDDPPFSLAELQEAFNSLNNRKAPGPDGFHADVVKEVFASNPAYFQHLYNGCLTSGYFPKGWKRAHVVMFHKSGKKDNDPFVTKTHMLAGHFWKGT